jgi:acyl-homoserine lactone acylase PvdQ
VLRIPVLSLVLCALLAAPASAQLPQLPGSGPQPQPYQANDAGGFRDILPPGTRGRYNAVELAAFLANGTTVPHCCDQLRMYSDLVYATPGLTAADIPKYFKDSSFGVQAGNVERTYSPRSDVTIVRDRAFGVPHVYGKNRDGAMFGLGYVGAEDRLFFMDVLRHAGRGQLSSFAGGSNAAMDAEQWEVAPYTEADLERQAEQIPRLLGPQGEILRRDVDNYVAGINQYISEARLDPTKMPGEYAATGHPLGPDPWKRTDLIATASLVGGIFGRGGGNELAWSEVADSLQDRFGKRRGMRVFRDFRAAEDRAAPVTVLGKKRFPYQVRPRRARGVARPDPGSLQEHHVAGAASSGAGASASSLSLSRGVFPPSASNAVLISGRESQSGHPLMVAGPQVAYFNPQILMEQDVHAPAAPGLPGIDAQGASFVGINLYVQLGRGRDYAWSATSAGQDNIDTFALPLCEPGGAKPTINSMHYRFRGRCLAIEVLERQNQWAPTPGDPTPPGQQTLRAERTKMGLIAGRGTVRGKPVAFAKLRSTYFHEVDSAAGFMDFNTPEVVRSPRTFQRAANKIGYTFNWFYADSKHIAYFNSGANPVRAKRTNQDFPVQARYEWRGWNPDDWLAKFAGFRGHPRVIDQKYLVNWNNKQARGFRASDTVMYSSTYRSVLLEDRVKRGIRGARKLTLPQTIDLMEVAGTDDLRAHAVLPLALKIVGRPRDPSLRSAVDTLRAWRRAGGLRKDADRNGVYDHTDAVRIMDAWWPRLVRAQFQPVLGRGAFARLATTVDVDNEPNNHGQHLGSAYQDGWYGYSRKDLMSVLGRRVRGPYSRRYCGKGSLKRCRTVLRRSLAAAIKVPAAELYGGDEKCPNADQWCFDAVNFRATGGATQPLIHWINRPTFQQVNEIQRQVPR